MGDCVYAFKKKEEKNCTVLICSPYDSVLGMRTVNQRDP